MPGLEPLPEALSMQIRRCTRPVPPIELEQYIHYRHIEIIREASHRLRLFVLMRRTNPRSIEYVGHAGFEPKPLACKIKSAMSDAELKLRGGRRVRSHCAGLVVSPRMVKKTAFGGSDYWYYRAVNIWRKYWPKGPPAGFSIQRDEDSGYYGCVMLCTSGARGGPHTRHEGTHIRPETVTGPGGEWGRQFLPDRDIDPHALSTLPPGCSYMHGDYDLYALVHRDHLSERHAEKGDINGQEHMFGPYWRSFEAFVRSKININMIRHGSQEHDRDHTDEVVDMFCPTPERALRQVAVDGAQRLRQLYLEAFQGREPKRD